MWEQTQHITDCTKVTQAFGRRDTEAREHMEERQKRKTKRSRYSDNERTGGKTEVEKRGPSVLFSSIAWFFTSSG
ncbi:hypothetical protein QQF64_032256 [Cirrhinus molitorella]|uniref:Uncharacterized protein n=1 Tax=Cirrhinus molitorella TaxID=172907 RepID=A0ABR3MZD9_9TELE